jgi:hypothetical protein
LKQTKKNLYKIKSVPAKPSTTIHIPFPTTLRVGVEEDLFLIPLVALAAAGEAPGAFVLLPVVAGTLGERESDATLMPADVHEVVKSVGPKRNVVRIKEKAMQKRVSTTQDVCTLTWRLGI